MAGIIFLQKKYSCGDDKSIPLGLLIPLPTQHCRITRDWIYKDTLFRDLFLQGEACSLRSTYVKNPADLKYMIYISPKIFPFIPLTTDLKTQSPFAGHHNQTVTLPLHE